ncbi:polysaccharide deacetylase family protein [Streptomyces sp. NPDC048483]|uniref:polysaccharide deacetylase family protein n=1 Tax=Streptomyces sp. NPDC048483 TaxID=3154927 RepID=UPI0034382E9D
MTPFSKAVGRAARGLLAVAMLGAAAVPAGGQSGVAASPPGDRPRAVTGGCPAPDAVRKLYGSENRTMRTRRRVMALTFNAAWNEKGIATVLGVLRRRHAPATFFLTGDFAHRYPAQARTLAAAGHGIGNHSYSHPHFAALRPSERAADVLKADRALRAATGAAPLPFFRFPYSETSPQEIAEVNALGFADIEFTTDTNGYLGTPGGMSVRRAVRRAVGALEAGAILQMHVGSRDGRDSVLDAQALPGIIDAVRARGYEITDLRDLLGAREIGCHGHATGTRLWCFRNLFGRAGKSRSHSVRSGTAHSQPLSAGGACGPRRYGHGVAGGGRTARPARRREETAPSAAPAGR